LVLPAGNCVAAPFAAPAGIASPANRRIFLASAFSIHSIGVVRRMILIPLSLERPLRRKVAVPGGRCCEAPHTSENFFDRELGRREPG
jgi:hypothetical protein